MSNITAIPDFTASLESTIWTIFGDPVFIGAFIGIVFLFYIVAFRLSPELGIFVFIPVAFLIAEFIPGLLIVVLLLVGLAVGMALLKLIR